MAGTGRERPRARTDGIDLGADWTAPQPKAAAGRSTDWKRWFLVIGLGGLSWVATFVGMLELIEANVGDLPFGHKAIIGFSVAMLMVMVVWLLDQIFSDIGWMTRLLYAGGYVFLTLISVGFGFGFYWKVLESRGESSRSAEAAVGQVQTALHAGVTRLEQLQGTLDNLTTLSTQKAVLEREQGTSCPNSRPGDGPRRQLRDDDASRFKFAADFVRGRVGSLKSELGGLNGDLAKVVANDRATVDATGTRNEYMRGLNRRLDMTVTGFNAFRSDPQLRQIRVDLADRADRASFADARGVAFQCPDAQLSTALKGVVRAIDELPVMEKPKIAAVEGSEAVIEAFRRLTASLFGMLSFKMPPSPEELRELQKKAVQSVEASPAVQARLNAMAAEAGLSKRDYVPLAIALFVDLCLLLVSIRRPARGLDRLLPKMREAEQGPVIQILSRFNEIHRDREIRENFELFRHVVFDFHGDYYAAVPLNAAYRPSPRAPHPVHTYGAAEAETLVQEAHLLANLFASFEKERIFTRVMSPLLTTAAIQKRLRRQGSKFANAEAFRVYRFRDGAWSEIILGAVMGAARRVEGQKRRRRVEEELFNARGPDFERLRTAGAGGPDERDEGAAGPGRSGRADDRDRGGRGHWQPDGALSRTARHDGRGFSPRLVPTGDVDRLAATRTRREPELHMPDETAGENVILHPAVGRPPAPAAERMPPHDPESAERAGVAVRAEAPAPAAAREAVSAPAESLAPAESATVTVSATRESVTYTLPASEARLPESLIARAGRTHAPQLGVMADDTGPAAAERASIRPIAAIGEAASAVAGGSAAAVQIRNDGNEAAPVPSPGTAADLEAFALRFGPQNREG